MSAIAEFIRLPTSSVEQLRFTYDDTMESGEPVAEYDYSGYVLGTLLPFLDNRDIKLGRSLYNSLINELSEERGISLFILTPAHRNAYLARLSPEQFSVAELQAFYNRFNSCAEGPEVGEAMLAGVVAFRESLASLNDDSVVVCTIG